MQTTKTDLEPVREHTDRGLDDERTKTDAALGGELRGAADDAALGLERAETDVRLLCEREKTDELVDDAGELLFDEQAAHVRSNRARDERLAMVSHELRSPLTAILLNAQSLLEAVPPGGSAIATLRYAEDIKLACGQMGRLVGDLLDLASMEAGRLGVTLATGDAVQVMRDAVAVSAPLLVTRRLALIVDQPAGPLFARFDHPRLLQVFTNLFANSVKFTRDGGTISVGASRIGTAVQFCVADTGCGISPEDTAHVFERFWQQGGKDRRGLGLGLYICKAIVEAHGGTIWVSSEVGVGSRFYFTVPEAH
jgi:signal transduction histidine kinase